MKALLALLALACVACSDSEAAPQALPDAVGPLEIPVALRTSDTVTDRADIAVSPTEIRLSNVPVLTLERGKVPSSERSGHAIPKLRAALTAAPARSVAALTVHAIVPYETLALVLGTLEAAGIKRVAFATRNGSAQPKAGWLTPRSFTVIDERTEPYEFNAAAQRSWDEFAAGWEQTSRECGRAHSVFCAPVPTTAATGGRVQITLTTKGSAANVDFKQFDAPPQIAPPAAAPMLDGLPSAEALPPEPPTAEASFSWRAPAMTADLSPIVAAFRPLCGARTCGVVHAGAVATLSGRVISFLGAAFSDGFPAPEVVFVFPAR